MKINYKKLFQGAIVPQRATNGSSGFDLFALDVVPTPLKPRPGLNPDFEFYVMGAGERVLVHTGIAVGMPQGMEAQVRPRSGLALRHGITVLNTPGTVDADYVGEICVVLLNTSRDPFKITAGDRIAQLVFAPVFHDLQLEEAGPLGYTSRNAGGFGHTGVR